MTDLFERVKQLIINAMENGYDPLAQSARELAEDIIETTGECEEEGVEAVTKAAQQVKDYFEGDKKDE